MNQGYKKLEIYRQAHQLAIHIHHMTMRIPSFERFEEGSQIRRSAKSVSSNIVEGYALRRYKNEFIHFLFRAYGSCEETLEHLELLHDTHTLIDAAEFSRLHRDCNNLCGKLLRYIQAVSKNFELPLFIKSNEDVSLQHVNISRTPNPKPRTSV